MKFLPTEWSIPELGGTLSYGKGFTRHKVPKLFFLKGVQSRSSSFLHKSINFILSSWGDSGEQQHRDTQSG